MKLIRDQRGIVPIPVIIGIAVLSAVAGAFAGYQIGDGTFFSFGVGFGVVFFILLFLSPHISSFVDLVRKSREKK